MFNNTHKESYKSVISFTIIFIALIPVVLYNGYPLVTSDTGSYIRHGFDFQVPADRSPFYGLFLGISSLRSSAFITILVQQLITAFLIFRLAKLLIGRQLINYIILSILIILGTQTPWISSYLMPDIFTGLLVISTLLYLFDKNTSTFLNISYLSLITLSILVHYSHFLLLPTTCIVLLIIAATKKKKAFIKKLYILLSISCFCWVSMLSLNYIKGFGITLSAGSHVFMIGKFAEDGLLEKYLDDSCTYKTLRLCAYKSQIPEKAYQYLWDENNSPLYKTGGWQDSEQENLIIIRDVFTTPTYIKHFLSSSMKHSITQVTLINMSDIIPSFSENTSPHRYINKYLTNEAKCYNDSKQTKKGLKINELNKIYFFFSLWSTLLVLVLIVIDRNKSILWQLYGITLLFIIGNAFITATFANVLDRLQYRIWWVLPVVNAIIIVSRLTKYKYQKNGIS